VGKILHFLRLPLQERQLSGRRIRRNIVAEPVFVKGLGKSMEKIG
jgi:hypothetical protein